MSNIFSSGISGLLVAQRALATTSQNINNVNTEGYSRQRVELTTRTPDSAGYGFVGTGVQIASIERIYDSFISNQLINGNSLSNQFNEFHSLSSRVSNLLADSDAGLMPGLQGFFDAVQAAGNDPMSVPARQVLMSESETLVARFQYLAQGLNDIGGSINKSIQSEIDSINNLTGSLADVNRQISTALSTSNGNSPNDLLDHRDQLLLELAEHVSITTVEQDDGQMSVFVGSGQAVVVGFDSRDLNTQRNVFDSEQLDVGLTGSGSGPSTDISQQISGGALGAFMSFRDQLLNPAKDALGHVAIGVVDMFNQQHRLGLDLNGTLGGDFFTPLNSTTPEILGSSSNVSSAAQISLSVTDASQLTGSNYRLERSGGSYLLTRLDDNTTTTLTTFGTGTGAGFSETIDGVNFFLNSGTIADGDVFMIHPSRSAAANIQLAITSPHEIALAGPVRTGSSLANTGDASIDGGMVVDRAAYTPDNYSMVMADSTVGAIANFVAFNDDAATANTLQYQLSINGTQVYTQNEGAALLADADALAAAINGSVATTGVRAYVDGGTLFLANDPATALPINLTEQMVDSGGTPMDAADTVSGYFGSALTGAAASNAITYSNSSDSYLVLNGAGAAITSGAYNATGTAITFNGIQTTITGAANSGDQFTLSHNSNGVSDNRNALLLAGLNTRSLMVGGTVSYKDLYGELIADVSSQTHQAEVNGKAQESLFQQNLEARAAKSGVNLDEEAANMLQYQQAYQAAAKVISTADQMFQTLLTTMGR